MALTFNELIQVIPLVLHAGNVPTIVGEAGIGKTALVAKIAQQMGAQLFTTVVSLSEKGDLAMPIPPLTDKAYIQTTQYGELADVAYGYTHTLIAIILAAERTPKRPIIWFLDEFNRGSQAVQSELMNLVLQREINGLVLPDNVQLILAENPDSTMVGFSMSDYNVVAGDAAIKDRTTRLVMRVDAASWLNWAAQITDQGDRPNIHPYIQEYLTKNSDDLFPVNHDDDLYPTPRAWQRVSEHLYELNTLPETVQKHVQFDLFAGDLGGMAAQKLVQFLSTKQENVTVESLFESQPVGPQVPQIVLDIFLAIAEVQKLSLLQEAILRIDLTTPNNAGRFNQLLILLAADSQYVIAKKLMQGNLLEKLFVSSDINVTALYQTLMQVATYDTNI